MTLEDRKAKLIEYVLQIEDEKTISTLEYLFESGYFKEDKFFMERLDALIEEANIEEPWQESIEELLDMI